MRSASSCRSEMPEPALIWSSWPLRVLAPVPLARFTKKSHHVRCRSMSSSTSFALARLTLPGSSTIGASPRRRVCGGMMITGSPFSFRVSIPCMPGGRAEGEAACETARTWAVLGLPSPTMAGNCGLRSAWDGSTECTTPATAAALACKCRFAGEPAPAAAGFKSEVKTWCPGSSPALSRVMMSFTATCAFSPGFASSSFCVCGEYFLCSAAPCFSDLCCPFCSSVDSCFFSPFVWSCAFTTPTPCDSPDLTEFREDFSSSCFSASSLPFSFFSVDAFCSFFSSEVSPFFSFL
mmetsp:Transcript_24451/g.61484  ORF Transcript_24451/g.61484 Transcript_24451/m.61484 type:complete len:293 (+) Transcript_24451:1471-2349(+)